MKDRSVFSVPQLVRKVVPAIKCHRVYLRRFVPGARDPPLLPGLGIDLAGRKVFRIRLSVRRPAFGAGPKFSVVTERVPRRPLDPTTAADGPCVVANSCRITGRTRHRQLMMFPALPFGSPGRRSVSLPAPRLRGTVQSSPIFTTFLSITTCDHSSFGLLPRTISSRDVAHSTSSTAPRLRVAFDRCEVERAQGLRARDRRRVRTGGRRRPPARGSEVPRASRRAARRPRGSCGATVASCRSGR